MSTAITAAPRRARLGAAVVAASAAVSLLAAPLGAAAQERDPAAPVPTSSQDDVRFDDLDDLERGYAIEALAEEGVLRGCEEERFCPEGELSRGQAASLLAGALGIDPIARGPFTDIAGSVHEGNINALADAGILRGCSADRFCLEDPVSRGQFASLLASAYFIPATDEIHFDDTDGVHGRNVNALGAVGLVTECGERLNEFCVDDPIIRYDAGVFLARAMWLSRPVELAPLAERREEQARRDAEEQARREAEEQARREAEEQERYGGISAERLAMWERLAQCESNGRWNANTGNGYYGGLQFHIRTWRSVGGTGYPHQASKEEQIYRAERLLQKPWATFANQWPACSRRLGLR